MPIASNTSKKSCFFSYFVIFLLPFLLLLVIVAGYLKLINLNVEIHTLIIISVIFMIFTTFIGHNAYVSSCKFSSNSHKMQIELQNFISKHSMTLMKKKKSILSIDNFFEIEYKKLRNDNYANVAAGVFPTLGILGTFIAIALSMPDFSVKDTASLDMEITKLLGGVGTAFYASIYGIFLSLWWIFFEKGGLSSISSKSDYIKEKYNEYFWSDSELRAVEYLRDEEQNDKFIQSLSQTLSLDFASSFNEINSKKMELVEKISRSEELMHQKMEKIYTQMLQLHEVAAHKQIETMKVLDNYKDGINSNNIGVSSLLKELDIVTKSFSNISRDINIITNVQKSSEDSVEKFIKVAQNFDEKFSKNINYTLESIDSEVANIVKKLALSTEYISKEGVALQESLKQYHDQLLRKI